MDHKLQWSLRWQRCLKPTDTFRFNILKMKIDNFNLRWIHLAVNNIQFLDHEHTTDVNSSWSVIGSLISEIGVNSSMALLVFPQPHRILRGNYKSPISRLYKNMLYFNGRNFKLEQFPSFMIESDLFILLTALKNIYEFR